MTFDPAPSDILDHLGNAVLVFDCALHLTFINPAGEMLLEISARQALGLDATALFSNLGQKVQANLERTIASGATLVERFLPLQLSVRELVIHCTMTPWFDGHQVRAVIMELENVAHYEQLSRDEYWLIQQNTVHQLLRSLAHEIKNPLGGLRGAAQLLSAELPDQALHEYTEVIIAEADRLQSLIDRLLTPYQAPVKTELNIHQVLERVRQLLEAEYTGLHFNCDYDPSLPRLFGDPDQLIQAILNIARNAAQALEGNGKITLRTRIQRQFTIRQHPYRLVVRIDIIDHGPGVPEPLRDRIFYPLVTSRADGTGLGLSIAQSLVHRNDGLIEYDSKPGQTVFSIYFPVENDAHA